MAKGFGKGVLTGVAGTVAALAGAVYAFKKKVIEPEEQKAASAALPAITVKKPVGAPAAADLPSQANVTGTTNARFGAAAQEDRDNNNVAYDAVYQAGTYPVAPAAGTADGLPLNDAKRNFGDNTRFGAAGQGTDIKKSTTFENTNYSAVVNGN